MQDLDDAVSDPQRLAELQRTGLLDTDPEEMFDQVARVAAHLIAAPVALVSLVDKERQFFKSRIGLLPGKGELAPETPLSQSICKYAVASREPIAVVDAREHEVLSTSEVVSKLGVVSYLGSPLILPSGHAIGALCVVDSKPRQWNAEQIGTLRALSSAVVTAILRRAREYTEGGDPDQLETGERIALLPEAAATLASAVANYFKLQDECRFAFEQPTSSQAQTPSKQVLNSRLLQARDRLRASVFAFESVGINADAEDAKVRMALELRRCALAYIEAEARRAEVVKRFWSRELPLQDAEMEATRVLEAEQSLRLSLHEYELAKD